MNQATIIRQRDDALDKANRVRTEAAQFRREVRSLPLTEGRSRLADALENGVDTSPIGSLPVARFLSSPHRQGPANVNRLCRRASLTRQVTGLTVRDLTPHERTRLVAALRDV